MAAEGSAPMEVEAPEAPEPEPVAPPEEPEPAKPPEPKPKPRKKKETIRDPVLQELPSRAKRQNQRVATPPALVVDQTFWTGLLATQKARGREARQEKLSNFRIFG